MSCENDPINKYFLINCIFHSSGSCEQGTFLCDVDGDFKCLPHHLVCGQKDGCREKYKVICGLFYGHVDYIKKHNISDVEFTSVELKANESSSCGK